MKSLLIIFSLFLVFTFSCEIKAQTVSGLIDKATVRRGKMESGKIILTIPPDLHVNSNMPNDEFTIPTAVKLSGSNVKINKIIYPKGVLKKFEFAEKPLSVYEGKVVIKFTFTVPANFKKNEIKLNVVIHYQACNREVCFVPKKEKIVLSARIK